MELLAIQNIGNIFSISSEIEHSHQNNKIPILTNCRSVAKKVSLALRIVFAQTTMKKSAIYTVGRQLNDGDMYIFSVFDLEPAGLLVILCCSTHNNTKYIDGLKITMF
jgi:hypothetical protein